MIVAIVPARGGSKRIQRKNVKPFCGKPLIAWSIEAAKASRLFDRIVVSTDDVDVATVARQYGAETPFARPASLSDDHATTDDVVLHATTELRDRAPDFETGCCIYPSPFVTGADLRSGLDLLSEHNATSCFPVVRYDFPIEHALVLDGARPRPRWPDKLDARSQDLPVHVHDAGMFYWFTVDRFLADRRLIGADAVAFVVPPEHCHDINTPEDWARAEDKFKLLTGEDRR